MKNWSIKKIISTGLIGLTLIISVFLIGLDNLKAFIVEDPGGFGDSFSNLPVETPTLPGGSSSTNLPQDSGPTPSVEDIYTFSEDPDLTDTFEATQITTNTHQVNDAQNIQNRQQADTQTAKQEAQKIQTQQQQDLQKCMEEGSGGAIQGPLNETINESLSNTVGDVLQQDLPAKLNEEIKTALPQALNEEIKKQFPGELSTKVKAELEQTLPNAIRIASNNGANPLTQDDLKLVIKDQLSNAIKNNFGDALTTSVKTGFPNAIKSSVETSVPKAVDSVIKNNLPSALATSLPQALQGGLGDISQALIIGGTTGIQSAQSSPLSEATQALGPLTQLLSLIPGFGSIFQAISQGTQILGTIDAISQQAQALTSPFSDTQIQEMSDKLISEYSRVALEEINGSLDDISGSINTEIQRNLDSVLDNSLGDLDGLIDSQLGNLDSQINSSIDSIFSNATGAINQSIDGIINQTLDSTLGNFTGVFDQTIGNITNFVPNLLNDTMGEFTNVFSDSLNGITDSITGSINGVISGITSPITGAVNNVVSSITAPVTGAINNVVSGITAPITGALNNVVSSITEPITGVMNNVVGNVTGAISNATSEITNNVIGSVTGGITENLTAPLEGALNNVTGGLASSIPGVSTLTSAVGIGMYVPVKEVSGPLLSTTQSIDSHSASIDTTTQSIQALTVEICTYLKSIKRIETAMEQKTFVEDVNLRRQAGNEVNSYRAELKDLTEKGYDSTGQGADAPLYVQNTRAHINEVVIPEATKVFIDDLNNSEDIWKDTTVKTITQQISEPITKSTVTKEEYDRFTKGEIEDSDTWFKTLIAISDPFRPNSPETSYRINNNLLAHKQFQAEQDSLQEINAGQGYLPVRECAEYTTDGSTCRRWVTVTPATQVRESNAQALDYRLDLYTEPEAGDVAPDNGPTIEETRTFKPATTGGGGSGPGSASGIDQIISLITSLFNGGGNGGVVSNPAPTISMTKILPVTAGGNAKIAWTTTNASACVAGNNWITSGGSEAPLNVGQIASTALQTNGNRTIYPINFGLRLTRIRTISGVATEGSLPVEEVKVSGIVNTKKINIAEGAVQAGDVLKLSLWPYTTNLTISVPILSGQTKTQILQNLYTQAGEAKNTTGVTADTFKQFDFIVSSGGETLTVAPKVEYSLSCRNASGQSITKSITL